MIENLQQEVRVGNYVTLPQNAGIYKITAERIPHANMYRPLKITSDMLIKLGFTAVWEDFFEIKFKDKGITFNYWENEFDIQKLDKTGKVLEEATISYEVKYVHQLQNIIFSICNEELKDLLESKN